MGDVVDITPSDYDHEQHMRETVRARFRVTADDKRALTTVRYVSAEAGTGWRYAAVVSPLPPAGAEREGGPMMVTLLAPWVAAWPLQPDGHLSEEYVAEHFSRRGGPGMNREDALAVTLLLRHALDR